MSGKAKATLLSAIRHDMGTSAFYLDQISRLLTQEPPPVKMLEELTQAALTRVRQSIQKIDSETFSSASSQQKGS